MRNLVFLLILVSTATLAQEADSLLFKRIQAIGQNGFDFFNVDGVDVSFVPQEGEFTPKNIVKRYRQMKVKTTDLVAADDELGRKNYFFSRPVDRAPGLTGFTDYYFVEDKGRILGFYFESVRAIDRNLERQIIRLCADGKMPLDIYQPEGRERMNFAGRIIDLGGTCNWMSVNNLQCPYNGQMNWSSHKTLDDAQREIDDHFRFLNTGKRGKIISDEMVEAVFEGSDVKVRRLVFDLTGVTSALVGMSGGKTLTIYMVAAPARDRFVSCVISHWNNDSINENGLPALAAEVMTLK